MNHNDNLASEAELFASLGSTDNLSATPASEPTSKGFLTKQYQLMSTPYFVIYLQAKAGASLGLLDPQGSPDALLEKAFEAAIFRKVGRNVPALIATNLTSISKAKYNFYKDKAFHKGVINLLLEEGPAPLNKATCLTRAFPLAAIESYLNDLAAYVVEEGYSTLEEYISSGNASKTAGLTLATLDDSVWDDL